MNGESLDIKQDQLQRLKELFPEVFTENQLDWEKLKAAFGEDINFANERYVLNWAGKSDAFKVLQQPTTATLKPIPEESVNFDKSENLFIEGENLEVLKVLQKAYYGKVKCIIIDPPYNTGSDSFIYPDKFSEKKEDYLKRIGDKDEEGYLTKEGLFRKNSKDSGHYHSNWLSMMYPRLFLATTYLSKEVGMNEDGNKEILELFDSKVFSFPKPVSLIEHLLTTINDKDFIVLDFFGGSGTTAQAVMELNKEDGGNRKYIVVQLPEPCDEDKEAYKAGYKTIADIGKDRIRRVIKKIDKEKAEKPGLFDNGNLDLGFKVFKLSSSNFKIWRSREITEENLEQQLDAFTNPARPGAEKQNMLYELMLKAGHELTSPVQYIVPNHPSPQSSPAEGRGGLKVPSTLAGEGQGGGYYSIDNNELIIALDAMSEKFIEQIIAAKPQKVITLDSLFTGNDQLKTNTVLQMRDAGVDFKTI